MSGDDIGFDWGPVITLPLSTASKDNIQLPLSSISTRFVAVSRKIFPQ